MSSAKGFLDKAEFEFECPSCGRRVKTTIGAGRRNQTIRCPGGHKIHVDGSDLDRGTRKVERQMGNLFRKLR